MQAFPGRRKASLFLNEFKFQFDAIGMKPILSVIILLFFSVTAFANLPNHPFDRYSAEIQFQNDTRNKEIAMHQILLCLQAIEAKCGKVEVTQGRLQKISFSSDRAGNISIYVKLAERGAAKAFAQMGQGMGEVVLSPDASGQAIYCDK
jgi:hypothetical protein